MFDFTDKKSRKTTTAIIAIVVVLAMIAVPLISSHALFAG